MPRISPSPISMPTAASAIRRARRYSIGCLASRRRGWRRKFPIIGQKALPCLRMIEPRWRFSGGGALPFPRACAVGEEPPTGLAVRAVVRLVVRVGNPRDRRPASRARFSVPSVDRHAFVKGGHLLGEAFAGFAPKTLGPFEQRPPRRVEEPLHLLFREASRELHRRKPRGVEDLVGVRITDAAEETRIGERPLDCMALTNERVVKALEIGIENFQTARIV